MWGTGDTSGWREGAPVYNPVNRAGYDLLTGSTENLQRRPSRKLDDALLMMIVCAKVTAIVSRQYSSS